MDYDGSASIPTGFQYQCIENSVSIYKNTNYIPMGYYYDYYCNSEELIGLSTEEKSEILLSALVVEQENDKQVSKLLDKLSIEDYSFDFQEEVKRRRESSCSYFVGTSRGFEAQIQLSNSNILFFSVPYDEGWNITVNGEKADIYKVNFGLLGIRCIEGVNNIRAIYKTKGLFMGGTISILCMFAFIGIEFYRSFLYNSNIGNFKKGG